MTEDQGPQGPDPGADGSGSTLHSRLARARSLFELTSRALLDNIARVQAGDDGAARELDALLRNYQKALFFALEQESRIDDRLTAGQQARDARSLDLAAARAEVGRRLACLRTAGGDGELS